MARRYRVVRLITRLNIGGPAIHTILLTAGLDRSRFDCLLVTGAESPAEGNMLPLAERVGVRPVSIPELGRAVRPGQGLIAFARVVRLLRRCRPAIVHTHMAKAGAIGRVAARLAGVPIVVHTYHGHVFHSYFDSVRSAAFLTAERLLGRVSDALIAVGDRQRDEIAAYGIGTSVLQAAYQRGDALTAAGTATMVTNAVPIAAGFVLFGERLPHGSAAILQVAAFACLVVSAVALGHRQAPGGGPSPQAQRGGTRSPRTPGSAA